MKDELECVPSMKWVADVGTATSYMSAVVLSAAAGGFASPKQCRQLSKRLSKRLKSCIGNRKGGLTWPDAKLLLAGLLETMLDELEGGTDDQ